MKVSAIITAYKSEDYIERCLDSVCSQVDEVVLGVDACQVTLQKVKEIKHKYSNLKVFMNVQNVGTYITRNTMYQFVSNDWILQFDSDDELLPNTIEQLKQFENYQVIKFLGYNIMNGQRQGKVKHFTSPGIYHKSVFEKIGGYSPIRVAGDAEFKRKIKGNFREVRTNVMGMIRYIYPTSLTQTPETAFRSKTRLDIVAGFQRTYPNLKTINPVTTQCYKIENSTKQIVFGIASINDRVDCLKDTIHSIYSQCDKIIVGLNNYKEVPEFLKKDKITTYILDNSKGDAVKYIDVDKYKNCYYFSADDDIIYPSNYVENMISNLKESSVIGVHGYNIINKDFNKRKVYHFKNELDNNVFVDVVGTGTCLIDTSKLKISIEDFKKPNMADAWLSLLCKQQNVKPMIIKRKKDWLIYNDKMKNKKTIFNQKIRPTKDLINDIYA